MIPLRSCCSPTYDYKQLGKKDSEEESNRWVQVENMKLPLRQDEEGRDVVVRIDSENNGNDVNGDGGKGGIWRGSSYDFMSDPDKIGTSSDKTNTQGESQDRSRSFDFRAGTDPTSKLIGDFLERERLSGQKSLDFDMEELHFTQFAQENDSSIGKGRQRSLLSTVPEMERKVRTISSQQVSEAASPQRERERESGVGVLRSNPSYPTTCASPNSSMNARSPSASPKVQFESPAAANSKVQIGSPVYEAKPRYNNIEEELVSENENINSKRNSNSNSNSNNNSNRESPLGSDGTHVLRCSGRVSPNLNLLRTKTRSRLIDPPPPHQYDTKADNIVETGYASKRRSGQLKSGMIGKPSGMLEKLSEEEEDDPFKDCDLPDEYKRAKCDFFSIFQWLSFFVILGAFVCSLTIDVLIRKTVWDLHLWKWCLLVLVLFCGRLVSGWAIRILVFFVERNFLLRKRVLYFVYGLRKSVQNCLWLGLVLLAWHYLFDKKVERETRTTSLRYINKILVCLLVGTVIWLVKTLLVKVLASSFHVSTYFDRIQDSIFNQYVLETLSGPPLNELERNTKEEERLVNEITQLKEAGAKVSLPIPIDLKSTSKSGLLQKGTMTPRSGIIGKSGRSMGFKSGRMKEENNKQQEGITIDHLHKLNQKNISAWNMKRLMKIVRHGVLSTLDESFQDAATEDEAVGQIRTEWEAKVAAKKIFRNVAQPCSKHITLEDLMRFLLEPEALKAMALFEGAEQTNQVTKAALKNWVVNVFRERRALSLTLNDTKTAVNQLHRMVNVVVSLIIIVIWLLILGIATTHILVLISSQLLLVVFVFGNTCKTVFESIIFLFVMHPFDVGDRCSVDGVQMVVEEMNILTTVFLRYDNEKIWYPNPVLATKPISNFYRSPDMGDAVDFAIHIATPKEKVDIMKERILRYIDNKTEHWYANPLIVVKDIEDMNKMKMAVWLQHKMNHQDMGEKWVRRSLLVEEMISIFRDLDIEYRLLPRDINLREMPAISSTRLPSTWT